MAGTMSATAVPGTSYKIPCLLPRRGSQCPQRPLSSTLGRSKSRPRMRSGDGVGRRERLGARSPLHAGLAEVPFTGSPSLAWFMATASHLAPFRPPGFRSDLYLPPEGSS